MNVVLLFPGQGSQKPGMGRDLAAAFPAARAVFESADEELKIPLSRLCFEGPEDELTLTHNAQPALLAHSAAVWAVARASLGARVVAAAGHSLGEFSAYHAADSIHLGDALRLVRIRGELMLESGKRHPGTMAAILGETTRTIEEICAEATRTAGLVVPANYNCPGQLVVSGEESGVERAMVLCKESGAKRAMRLKVSGAFHSPLMESATPGLADALGTVRFDDPRFAVYANVNAEAVTTAARAESLLLEQLSNPVRWTEEIAAIAARYPSALYVEMGPGSVLTGLVRKIAPDVKTATCGTVADLEKLLELAVA